MARAIDGDKLVENLRLIATCWSVSPYVSKEKHNGAIDMLREVEREVKKAPLLTPPNEWVSVEERLPEHLKDVIALYGNGRIDIDWVDSSGDFKFGSLFDGVTHWMPLPAPPDRRPPEGEVDGE